MFDIVYSWVNSRDAEWLKRREQARKNAKFPTPHGTGEFRYADHEELRFSLRSVENYVLQDVRKIFIVHAGAPPSWLRPNEKITLVPQEQILPPGPARETYISDVIELYLHRIADLGERYLYFNDDQFLSAPLTEAAFFDPEGRAIVRFQPVLVNAPLVGLSERTYQHIFHNTYRALKKISGRQKVVVRSRWPKLLLLRRLLLSDLPYNRVAHICQPFRKSVWKEFHELFGDEIRALESERFRHVRGVAVNIIAHHLSVARGLSVPEFSDDHAVLFRQSNDRDALRTKDVILKSPANGIRFFSLNDGEHYLGMSWADLVGSILQPKFPNPSRFEIAPP